MLLVHLQALVLSAGAKPVGPLKFTAPDMVITHRADDEVLWNVIVGTCQGAAAESCPGAGLLGIESDWIVAAMSAPLERDLAAHRKVFSCAVLRRRFGFGGNGLRRALLEEASKSPSMNLVFSCQ